jgi:hypothetical protein
VPGWGSCGWEPHILLTQTHTETLKQTHRDKTQMHTDTADMLGDPDGRPIFLPSLPRPQAPGPPSCPHTEPSGCFCSLLNFSHFFILPVIKLMTREICGSVSKILLKMKFQSPQQP